MNNSDPELQNDYAERRGRKREDLTRYVNVFVSDSGALLGKLVDLSTDGMKLMSSTPIVPETTFDVAIEIPDLTANGGCVELSAQCRWCRPGPEEDIHDAGFLFLETTKHQEMLLQALLDAIAVSDYSVNEEES